MGVRTFFREGATGTKIAWRPLDGVKYRVEAKDDLRDWEWMDLSEEVVATSDTTSGTHSGAGGREGGTIG
ncbi:hypothetical protein HQ563_06980 [bacterium]|nr:hypothetical protein [bacterium]